MPFAPSRDQVGCASGAAVGHGLAGTGTFHRKVRAHRKGWARISSGQRRKDQFRRSVCRRDDMEVRAFKRLRSKCAEDAAVGGRRFSGEGLHSPATGRHYPIPLDRAEPLRVPRRPTPAFVLAGHDRGPMTKISTGEAFAWATVPMPPRPTRRVLLDTKNFYAIDLVPRDDFKQLVDFVAAASAAHQATRRLTTGWP